MFVRVATSFASRMRERQLIVILIVHFRTSHLIVATNIDASCWTASTTIQICFRITQLVTKHELYGYDVKTKDQSF